MPLADFIRAPEGDRVAINTDHIVCIEPHGARSDRSILTLSTGRQIAVQASADEGTVLKIADALNAGTPAYEAAAVDPQSEDLKPKGGRLDAIVALAAKVADA